MSTTTPSTSVRITAIGGPTALIEIGGLRILTDPTFSTAGPQASGPVVLQKLAGPALSAADVLPIDVVLLSHDQHADNLDAAGRELLTQVPTVLTTTTAAERLGGDAVHGLLPWQHLDLPRPDGGTLTVVAVPAQHGPAGTEPFFGPVIGFVLLGDDLPTIYVSGDNASLRVVEEVAHHLGPIAHALLFAGAARVPRMHAYLTLTSDQAATAAGILDARSVVPLHSEGWAHFTESRADVRAAFDRADEADRLLLLAPGQSAVLPESD
jgi:L-ascorbate metabolism protein UlaG (beta-lactamase superfamily)